MLFRYLFNITIKMLAVICILSVSLTAFGESESGETEARILAQVILLQ